MPCVWEARDVAGVSLNAGNVPWLMLLRISVRNLLRHRRRNGLLLVSVITAVASVTFLNALMRGIQIDMFDSARENLNGDLLVVAPGYLDDPGLMYGFVPPRNSMTALQARPEVRSTSRIRTPVVIMSERETRGVELAGVDPAEETFSFLARTFIDGRFPDAGESRGIVLGRALAEELRTRIGKRVVLVFRDSEGKSVEYGFRVTGLFDADGTSLEKRFAFTRRDVLGGAMRPGAVTEISVSLPESAKSASAHPVIPDFPGLEVRSWRQLEPQTAVMFDMLDSVMYVWFGIILAALGFGLVNAFVTAIMERHREFGVMRCLGMNRESVLVQVGLESGILMVCGVLFGTVLGALLVAWTGGSIDLGRWARGLDIVGFRSRISLLIEARDLIHVGWMSLLFGAVASLIPAMRANRVPALRAMQGP
jgi:ABC-type lipoprotein release transport system permease subunit